MKYKIIIALFLSLTVVAFAGFGGSDEPLIGAKNQGTFAGGAGAQFLKIGGGARAVAMGGAYVALRGNAQSVFWNPASLAGLSGGQLTVSHSDWLADMNYVNFSFATNFGNVSAAFYFTGLLSGAMERTTELEPDGTGEMFTANDFAVGFAFARNMTNKFAAGISLKMINENIDKVSAKGWAFDIGGTYNTGLGNNLRIGFSVRNFGPDMRYSGEGLESQTQHFTSINSEEDANDLSDSDVNMSWVSEGYALPLIFQVGIAYDLFESGDNKLLMTMDGMNAIDQNEQLTLGFEYGFAETYFLRMGFNEYLKLKKVWERDEDGEWLYEPYNMGLRAGFGADLTKAARIPLRLDYAFQTHGYLPPIHRFTLDFGL